MESLCFPRLYWMNLDFFMEIKRVRHLTELCIGRDSLEIPGINENVFELTNLKSLSFYSYSTDAWIPRLSVSPDHLTRLTKLDTDFMCPVTSIYHLTNLAILRVSICDDPALDECPPFGLKHLEELDIRKETRFMEPGFKGRIFSDLRRLKRLCIRDDCAMDGDFFTALGCLTQLSRFSFVSSSSAPSLEYCLQFNLLSGLRYLSISVSSEDRISMPDPCEFLLEGSFPLLRSLLLKGFTLSRTRNTELMRRFPSLNSLSGVG